MHANALIGIPYVKGGSDLLGADCWGLVLLTFGLIFENPIRLYEGSMLSGESLAETVEQESKSVQWEKIDAPEIGAVVVMNDRITKRPEHIGIMTTAGRVLHAYKKRGSVQTSMRVIERMFSSVEFYRYVGDNPNF